jgi:superfamily II DNA or RNA helicase
MSDWTEETLRKAASWKAFKEGQALLRDGCVTDAARTATGWRGTVRQGKRPLRVSVVVKSPSNLETRCPCPENQSSGALCCHALAAALAVLDPQSVQASQAAAATEAQPPDQSAPSRNVALGRRWQDALAHGSLAVTITHADRMDITPADTRLHAFLSKHDAPNKRVAHLQLRGPQTAGFLLAIEGHPALTDQEDDRQIDVTSGHQLAIADAVKADTELSLIPSPGPDWRIIDGLVFRTGHDFIHLAGPGIASTPMLEIIEPLARGKTAVMPMRNFLSDLALWQEWLELPDQGWLAELHFTPAQANVRLMLDGSIQQLMAQLKVAYPGDDPVAPCHGTIHSLPELTNGTCRIRNLDAEQAACDALTNAGFLPIDPNHGTWQLTGESAVMPFLTRKLPDLQSQWTITESPALAQIRSRILVVSPKIEILNSGDDWLQFDLHYQTADGQTLPTGEIRSLLKSGNPHRKLSGNRHLWIEENSAQVIETLIGESDIHQQNGHYMAKKCATEIVMNFNKNYSNSLISNNSKEETDFEIPASIHATLRPYQTHGCAWLADRLVRYGGALLADDMGLGKTIQTIVLIEYLKLSNQISNGPVLVIATTSLLGNWRAEIERFAPSRMVRVLHGSGREALRDSAGPDEIWITSYGTLTRDLAWHLRQSYELVVADEASLMRNPDTDHARAVAKLKSPHRIALTGTPVENGVRDLWSIFRFIQPGWLGGRDEFRERYELGLAQADPPGHLLRTLRLKTSPFILRRTKMEVAPELPGKLEIDDFCDLSRDQQSVYQEILAEGRRQVESLADKRQAAAARMRILTLLLRLRQTCCDLALLQNDRLNDLPIPRRSAKMERLLMRLDEAVSGSHRVLVFSQFQKQLLEIEKCVIGSGWRCLRLDGQTRNRQELVDSFQDPGGPEVFLISLKAGGYGLNLTAADTVIHFDPWWNPAAEAQASDRAHRIGQTRPVTVYRLLTRGTVEEKVLKLQGMKRDLARSIDEAGGGEPPAGWLDDPGRLRELFQR